MEDELIYKMNILENYLHGGQYDCQAPEIFDEVQNSAKKVLAEISILRKLCATAYQVVGAAYGPVELLDNLSSAASGEVLPHEPGAGLPWTLATKQNLYTKSPSFFVSVSLDDYDEKEESVAEDVYEALRNYGLEIKVINRLS